MNEPIISPWIFYCIGLIEPILIMGATFFFVGGFIGCMSYVAYDDNKETDSERAKFCYKTFKICFLFCFIGFLIGVFVPREDTVYKMLIASYVTPENINAGVQITKDGIQFIMQTIVDTAKQLKEI